MPGLSISFSAASADTDSLFHFADFWVGLAGIALPSDRQWKLVGLSREDSPRRWYRATLAC